jgi:hypothetical protein
MEPCPLIKITTPRTSGQPWFPEHLKGKGIIISKNVKGDEMKNHRATFFAQKRTYGEKKTKLIITVSGGR